MELIQRPGKKITSIYIVALVLIGLLTISSQLLVRNILQNQSSDSRVINIAGRQRMLSQKLAKTVLLIYQAANENDFAKRRTELLDVVDTWDKSHKGLQFGDSSLQLPSDNNSETIKEIFGLIEPHFLNMKNAVVQLSAYNFQTPKEQFKPHLEEIIENEPVFLRIMNEITFQYDKESSLKTERLKAIELVLMFVTLLVLFLEAVLVFRPAIRKIDLYFEQMKTSNKQLSMTIQELADAQEELRSYIDELQTSEEEIRQTSEELLSINDNLTEKQIIIEQQKEIILEHNKDIIDSIEAAKTIQDGVFMDQNTFISQFKDAFIINKPKDIVSGDFYYFNEIEDKTIIAAIDCTGHGIPGAFMSLIGNEILNNIIERQKITEPDIILNELHKGVRKVLKQDQNNNRYGMDAGLLVIDEKNKTASYAGAKNPLIYVQGGELFEIKADKMPIGGEQKELERLFTKHTVPLDQPTIFYLFTDGYQDQFGGEKGKKFMLGQMRALFSEMHEAPMIEQKYIMEKRFNDWKVEESQIDDILVVGIKI